MGKLARQREGWGWGWEVGGTSGLWKVSVTREGLHPSWLLVIKCVFAPLLACLYSTRLKFDINERGHLWVVRSCDENLIESMSVSVTVCMHVSILDRHLLITLSKSEEGASVYMSGVRIVFYSNTICCAESENLTQTVKVN